MKRKNAEPQIPGVSKEKHAFVKPLFARYKEREDTWRLTAQM